MTYTTYNKYFRIFLAMVLVVMNAAIVRCEPESAYEIPEPQIRPVEEAGSATFNRVFGQEGEAPTIDYYVVDVYNHSPQNSALRSAFVPGWGQAFNGQETKGKVLFGAFFVSLLGAVSLNNAAADSFREYEQTGLKDGDKYDDYDRQKTLSNILFAATGFLYVFGVVDAYRNAYKPLWTKNTELQLVLNSPSGSDLGGKLKVNKKF